MVGAWAPPARSSVTATVEPSGAGRVSLTTCLPPSAKRPADFGVVPLDHPELVRLAGRCSLKTGDRCRRHPLIRRDRQRQPSAPEPPPESAGIEPDRERRSGHGRRDPRDQRSAACGCDAIATTFDGPSSRAAARMPVAQPVGRLGGVRGEAERAGRLGQPARGPRGSARSRRGAPRRPRARRRRARRARRRRSARGDLVVRHLMPFAGIRRGGKSVRTYSRGGFWTLCSVAYSFVSRLISSASPYA